MISSKNKNYEEKIAYDFRKISSATSVARYISDSIKERLGESESVLWLVSGGSAIEVACEASRQLGNVDNLANLTISLTDERYGPVDHIESNWQKLGKAGFYLPGAKMIPVLSGEGERETIHGFKLKLHKMFSRADYKIGLFGMGADGHTAGILPKTIISDSKEMAYGYQAFDFFRITISPRAINLLNEAVLYVHGFEKNKALNDLTMDLPINVQPAQILKTAGKLIVYNDVMGEAK